MPEQYQRKPSRTEYVRNAAPAGTDPEVIDLGFGVVVRWRDRGCKKERRYPPGTTVIWQDGAFRIEQGKDRPQPRPAGM